MARRYPVSDIKKLFSFSAGFCSFPGCTTRCVVEQTDNDEAVVIGKVAHIEAHSDNGPRANPTLSLKERDSYENWILLCPTHHELVDGQSNTYTSEQLRRWKNEHEKRVYDAIVKAMPDVSFAELEVVCSCISGNPSNSEPDFALIPPDEKMSKNGLSCKVRDYILMGMVKSGEVGVFIEHVARIDGSFPERIVSGFVHEYRELYEEGLRGDDLFIALFEFSQRGHQDFLRQAAGLAVLVHLFEICEVFER